MFDPIANLSSLFGILFEIVGTTISALLLPFLTLVVGPIQSIFQLFAQGA